MIAPPNYKVEIITFEKSKGIAKLEDAMKVIERVIKEKQGTFKIVSPPSVIGAKDEKDIEDLVQKINDDNEEGSDEEDNEEHMGNIDLGDDEEVKQ